MPKVSVVCAECGLEVLRVPSQACKFCSGACAHAHRRRVLAEQNRADITCGACGITWNAPKSVADSGRKWCSKACQYSFPGFCAGCDAPFTGKQGQATCGDYKCRNAVTSLKRAKERSGRKCAYCLGPVPDQLKSDARFCSRACKDEDRKAQGRIERWSEAVVRPCADCGAPVGAIRSVFCEPCRTERKKERNRSGVRRSYEKHREKRLAYGRAYNAANPDIKKVWYQNRRQDDVWLESERARTQVTNRKRRALIRSLPHEHYTTAEIAERDGWRCQLCGKKVPAGPRFPDPRSASIDHIVPISDGGGDIKANVQLAHLRCNLSKHTRTLPQGEQLRLIG